MLFQHHLYKNQTRQSQTVDFTFDASYYRVCSIGPITIFTVFQLAFAFSHIKIFKEGKNSKTDSILDLIAARIIVKFKLDKSEERD